MIIREIPLEEIDFSDQSYRISEELDCPALTESLRAVGQLYPLCVLAANGKKTVVCGFRRLLALRQLGVPQALVRILGRESSDPVRFFDIALQDNLSHRQLNTLEKARALAKLKNLFRVPAERLVSFYLPLLGLAPGSKVLHSHILLDGVQPELRKCLLEGRLTQASVERLAEKLPEIQLLIARLMNRIRLSASLQKKVLDLMEELAVPNGSSWTTLLQNQEIQVVLEDPRLSPFQKGEKLYQILYRLRYPRLSRAAELFAVRKRMLELPGSIQISADPFFEEPGVHVEFTAPSAERFRELADALQKASRAPALDELFKLE